MTTDRNGSNTAKARSRNVLAPAAEERRADAKHRQYLRDSGFTDIAMRTLAKSQRERRQRRRREAWPVGRPKPVLIPWPQCTGTTRAGNRCRRGAIVDRIKREPLEGQRCRMHGGREALERHLAAIAAELQVVAAQVVQALDRLPMNKRRM